MSDDGSRITPTAHYTAAVWVRHGLAPPALATPFGSVLHALLAPMNALQRRWGTDHSDLDAMLLARHLAIDALLERDVASGRIGQVVEIAAGLSGRGQRLTRRHPGLVYVETDLPPMAARKRAALDGAGLRGPNHEVHALDALAADGPLALTTLAARLDPGRGTAIVTEGLLSYLALPDVDAMWRRFAAVLRGFPAGLYLADVHLADDLRGMASAAAFRVLLSIFARGQVRYHFATVEETTAALRAAGFTNAAVHRLDRVPGLDVPGGARRHLVRILAATT